MTYNREINNAIENIAYQKKRIKRFKIAKQNAINGGESQKVIDIIQENIDNMNLNIQEKRKEIAELTELGEQAAHEERAEKYMDGTYDGTENARGWFRDGRGHICGNHRFV